MHNEYVALLQESKHLTTGYSLVKEIKDLELELDRADGRRAKAEFKLSIGRKKKQLVDMGVISEVDVAPIETVQTICAQVRRMLRRMEEISEAYTDEGNEEKVFKVIDSIEELEATLPLLDEIIEIEVFNAICEG